MKSIYKREQKIVHDLLKLYCLEYHGDSKHLAPKCQEFYKQFIHKTENCPLPGEKPLCINCQFTCFQEQQKKRMVKIYEDFYPRLKRESPLPAKLHDRDRKAISS